LFHADWEARALALTLAMGATGGWNIDQSRSARETLPDYASLSYYRIWLAALDKLMIERGYVTPDELSSGRSTRGSDASLQTANRRPPQPRPPRPALAAADVPAVLARGSRCDRPVSTPARFAEGDRVRTRAGTVPHHSRIPAYVRGRVGTVVRCHGGHVFAEANAQGLGEQPQHLYTVAFEGTELWGNQAPPGLRVSIDAWESTLESAA
jgi:nitrile hydratase